MLAKRLKTISTITLLSLLFACGSVPKMERKVEVWNGAPERAGICRLSPSAIQVLTGLPQQVVHQNFKADAIICMDATDERFSQFAAMTFEDLSVVQKYIETLINRCEKWR